MENNPTLQQIDIPVDFKELITLQPLITQIEVFELLKKNLDKYRWDYFMSKQYTAAEVLVIIPVEQWPEYFENTFGDPFKEFRPGLYQKQEKIETLNDYLKDRYQKCCQYGSTTYKDFFTKEEKTAKHNEIYFEAVKEILIDTKNRKLLFVDHNIRHNHQWYGLEIIYDLKVDKKLGVQVLTVEFKWEFIPWYSNSSAPKYFSHFYMFDLTNDCVLKIDKSQMLR